MPFPKGKCQLNYARERMWEPGYLKAKCAELGLENEFRLYRIRLWKSYLFSFCLIHIFVTALHCSLLLTTIERPSIIYFDVGLTVGCAVVLLLVLSINFWDSFIAKHTWYMFCSSMFASLLLVFSDLTHSIYHHYAHNWQLGSFYDTYIVYMVYMFLPIHFMSGAVLLALLVSAVYIIYFVQFLAHGFTEFITELFTEGGMSVDLVHYLCLNLVGIFYRVMNDTVVRSSFLDRHQYIKEELWLRNARLEEKQLLDSILPPQISEPLQKEIQNRIILSKRGSGIRSLSALERAMAIQIHPDVSILYADVVNYTHLTTTLTVEKLVKVLHDLYGRFDLAALRFKVQRIKFLGDCYYCVAGLTDPDPDHATNCVALGLSMINEIMEVRDVQGLDINMRIGVHSGNIFAGVIGEAKLQFDIWGKDVTIANVLESTGVAGFVHISASTLNNLNEQRYVIEDGPEKARDHPLLSRYRIRTYIIREDLQKDEEESDENLAELHALSLFDLGARQRQSDNTNEILKEVFYAELREEFRKMPVSPFNPKTLYGLYRQKEGVKMPLYRQLNICLKYNDSDLERAYLKQTDYMYKYSMLLALVVGYGLVYIQVLDTKLICPSCMILPSIVTTVQTILTFIAWYKKMCWAKFGNTPHNYSWISCIIFRVHEKIIGSRIIRVFIYLFLVISAFSVMCLIVMTCNREEFEMAFIEERLFHYEQETKICFQPWVTSNMFSLMICLTFTFTHISLALKTTVAILETIGYLVLIFFQFEFVFHHSVTTNPSFPAEYAHALLICITLLTMTVKERQQEFTNKVNYHWRVELRKKEADANLTNHSIIIILNNILPSHIVDVYIKTLAKHELYYENYQMVSVMFAMLMNFEMDLRTLRILNEIIAEFDMLLLFYKEYYSVEKIKIVGCTYMAACGLDLNFAGSTSATVKNNELNPTENRGRMRQGLVFTEDEREREEVVFVMTSYALDMMRTLAKCNKAYQSIPADRNITDGSIAIGISSGEVMAGIVGASQPHYDIWGNPVNMASRMESTGLPGNIQVTEESAKILEEFGIVCQYRGLTFVKGRGEIPTYLVGIDDNLNFITTQPRRAPSHVERSTVISLQGTYSHLNVVDDLSEINSESASRHTFQDI
ncbi:adenylyl cyclase X E-like [Drosophila takahashii]|uniref:adenylyl cyclase X E-like n=1 Tax=Drosophila takahashii TaxID=29030 RepID=UPI001CF90A56|nr:adenylyl cyclase X E-like [Drosophila takahashii]